MRYDEENEPAFERLEEREQEGEIDDYEWSPYESSLPHDQRHPKLWNAACFVFGTFLGVGGLLFSQQATVRSTNVESTGSPNPVMPSSKFSIESRNVNANERKYLWYELFLNQTVY